MHLRPLSWLLYWSGAWATVLLLLTLFVTPARKIFRWGGLLRIRRMLGVTAFAYTLGHIYFFAAQEQFEAMVLLEEIMERATLMIAFLGFVGLTALALTSLDSAISRMGSTNWKRLHLLVYPTVGLAILHFLLSPSAAGGLPFAFLGAFIWLMAWRLLELKRLGTDYRVLFALGLAVTAFTVAFEAIWASTVHTLNPWMTLSFNFSLILGLSAGWQVFIGSMLVALGAWLRQTPRLASLLPPGWRNLTAGSA